MDIGALLMGMDQSRVQQSAGIAVMMGNVAVNSNVGQNLDVRA